MDVQCERCSIEYTFNDALVSVRGTPVRCTSCGHQFKVYPSGGPPSAPPDSARDTPVAPEQWAVRTVQGKELLFSSFRDLQNAILSKRVLRGDALVRDGLSPQPLGAISELGPLFGRPTNTAAPPATAPGSTSTRPSEAAAAPTDGKSSANGDPGASIPPAAVRASNLARIRPPREKVETLRPPAMGTAAPPPPPTVVTSPVTPGTELAPPAEASLPPQVTLPALPPEEAPAEEEDVAPPNHSLAPPPRPIWRARLPSDDELPDHRSPAPPSDEAYSAAPPRHVGGWIVALALLSVVGVVGWTALKPYLLAPKDGVAVVSDPRTQTFMADGERAMADGDLDAAQENFDKAGVLAEKDPRVLLDEARLAAAKADIPWLKLRLLSADAAGELRTTKAALDELVLRAKRASDAARTVAPDDVSGVRVSIDSLRLAGERDAARALVPKVIAQASQPETAYVLAALDLAEPEALWTTVIERLRIAAAGEGNAGRARAALVYALARSGDSAGANAELAKIDALVRPYPLLPALDAFVRRSSAVSKTAPSASFSVPVPTAVNEPSSRRRGAPLPQAPNDGDVDPRSPMQAASAAIKRGDLARAGQIYQSLASRNPNDSEALSGIGDVDRLTGNQTGAVDAYRRAIAVNPSYLPALLGLADTEWSAGERSAATHDYSDIVDRFPEGTYPPYVAKRAGNPAPAAPTPSTEAPAATDSTAVPAPDGPKE